MVYKEGDVVVANNGEIGIVELYCTNPSVLRVYFLKHSDFFSPRGMPYTGPLHLTGLATPLHLFLAGVGESE